MPVLDLLAAPAITHVSVVAAGYELGVGRTVPTAAAVLGLISAVAGGLALARSRRTGTGRARTIVALVLGPISVIAGGVHGVNSAGGLGTGNGLAGAVLAVALGLIGTVLGGLALARSRRTSRSGHDSRPVPAS
ncbi:MULTISPECIES: DUF6223 family protein [Rhodococcus]|uniref:Integral membrane protein n=2 Tax=Rhodococcus TaxID=1827 RepID=A0ABQ0YGI6_9NOCA|nr:MULTISPECIES: DUF6223 family protein [Rhodococcus]ETT28234.1 hypothetical protein RR21198_1145 [Rhodococcus rhodochrous ATCC 21198]MDF2711729.1 hypothetical protein [Nonomuraea muscovyensis]NCL77529.1 hypothetical protein [Rhodococcus sp. YH1]ANZ26864.1 hypothetical protein A4U64_20845 [Rhodococcus sp. WB1]KDE14633.1 hypothetical protein N505_0100600 [Rhodococcus aetherivorans]